MIKQGLTFDDVLLVPKYSEIESRSKVDLSVDLGKGIKLNIPIASANMKHITETEMAFGLWNLDGLPITHRFYETIEQQVRDWLKCEARDIGASVGVQSKDYDLVDRLVQAGCLVICVDVAHGDHKLCHGMVEYIAKKYSEVLLIAGNVCTSDGALRLYDYGADVVKAGVGGGSTCSTRSCTGNGYPQLSALMEIYKASLKNNDPNDRKFKIISDGGHKIPADIVKALCFSDAVMLGRMLAGTDETPGEIIEKDGKKYKRYDGSSTLKNDNVEGVKSLVPYKGSLASVLKPILDGLRSGCSYQNAASLYELKLDPQLVQITNQGLRESNIHDVMEIK